MGYWGWRRIAAVFISVWVVGCSVTHETAPTAPPTQPPYSTLIAHLPLTSPPQRTTPNVSAPTLAASSTPMVYMVQPGDTLLQIARRFGVKVSVLQEANGGIEPLALQIGQVLAIPSPQFNAEGDPILPTLTPAALSLSPPTCYPAPTDYIMCLGQVTNSLETAIQRVTVVVRLLNNERSVVVEGESAVEQSIIPPGDSAPYRLLLKADWEDYAEATVWLKSADSAPEAKDWYTALAVEDPKQWWADGRYFIGAVLHNPSSQTVQLIRAVLTLRDVEGQIVGYRVLQFNQLIAPDERIPIEIAIMPNTPGTAASHTLYAEARRVP
jgi:LysM repeat protein